MAHRYAGSNPTDYASYAHCAGCFADGHVVTHPELGCADVGCTSAHGDDTLDRHTRRALEHVREAVAALPTDAHWGPGGCPGLRRALDVGSRTLRDVARALGVQPARSDHETRQRIVREFVGAPTPREPDAHGAEPVVPDPVELTATLAAAGYTAAAVADAVAHPGKYVHDYTAARAMLDTPRGTEQRTRAAVDVNAHRHRVEVHRATLEHRASELTYGAEAEGGGPCSGAADTIAAEIRDAIALPDPPIRLVCLRCGSDLESVEEVKDMHDHYETVVIALRCSRSGCGAEWSLDGDPNNARAWRGDTPTKA